MTKFIMLCGLPGSGKSTYAEFLKNDGMKVHSSDVIRKELLGSTGDQSDNQTVFNTLHQRIKEGLDNGEDVVYDATNIAQKRRIAFLREIERYDVIKECHFTATSYDECVRRDATREKGVGREVIDKMYKGFWVPQYYEGWDKISIIWEDTSTEFNINDALDAMEDFDQKTPFHNLTLGAHMKSAYNWLASTMVERAISTTKNENLLIATRIHDIGKPFTQGYNVEKERHTYYQHHLTGAYDSLFYVRDLHLFEPIIRNYSKKAKTDDEILQIANYIQWHMYLYDMVKQSTREKFIHLVGKGIYNDIKLLHKADAAAHYREG